MSTSRACQLYGVSRQGRRQRQARQALRARQVLVEVRAVRGQKPRRKIRTGPLPYFCQRLAGRDIPAGSFFVGLAYFKKATRNNSH